MVRKHCRKMRNCLSTIEKRLSDTGLFNLLLDFFMLLRLNFELCRARSNLSDPQSYLFFVDFIFDKHCCRMADVSQVTELSFILFCTISLTMTTMFHIFLVSMKKFH